MLGIMYYSLLIQHWCWTSMYYINRYIQHGFRLQSPDIPENNIFQLRVYCSYIIQLRLLYENFTTRFDLSIRKDISDGQL